MRLCGFKSHLPHYKKKTSDFIRGFLFIVPKRDPNPWFRSSLRYGRRRTLVHRTSCAPSSASLPFFKLSVFVRNSFFIPTHSLNPWFRSSLRYGRRRAFVHRTSLAPSSASLPFMPFFIYQIQYNSTCYDHHGDPLGG